MTSLTGASGEDFASILRSLGYRMDRKPKPAEAGGAGRDSAGKRGRAAIRCAGGRSCRAPMRAAPAAEARVR